MELLNDLSLMIDGIKIKLKHLQASLNFFLPLRIGVRGEENQSGHDPPLGGFIGAYWCCSDSKPFTLPQKNRALSDSKVPRVMILSD